MNPGNRFVEFLNSYVNVKAKHEGTFDEYMESAVTRYGVSLAIPSTVEDALIALFSQAHKPASVILTGNAGDGKTYICRRVIKVATGQDHGGWPHKNPEFVLPASGYRLVVVKDLSELGEDDAVQVLRSLDASLRGQLEGSVFLIAANEGKLRHLIEKYHLEALQQRVNQLFDDRNGVNGDERLRLYNLTRVRTSRFVQAVLEQFTQPAAWEACAQCSAVANCPISYNARRLRDATPRSRLIALYEVLEQLDIHVTFRDLLIHIAYTLTGGLTCSSVLRSLTGKATTWSQRVYYELVWGYEHPRMAVGGYLQRVDVGKITRFASDDFIINKPGPETGESEQSEYERLFGTADVDMDGKLFQQEQDEYLRSGSEPGQNQKPHHFVEAWLWHCRRKLYFERSDESQARAMLPFKYLEDYRQLFGKPSRTQIDKTRDKLIRGMNRAFSGLYIGIEDELYVTSQYSHAVQQPVPIIRLDFAAREIDIEPGMTLADYAIQYPAIRVRRDNAIARRLMDLLMFEYLLRLAEGGTPNVLASECELRVRQFKDDLLTKFGLSDENDGAISFFAPQDNCYVVKKIDVSEKGIRA